MNNSDDKIKKYGLINKQTNALYNLLSQVYTFPELAILINNGECDVDYDGETFIIKHFTMGYTIRFDELENVRWHDEQRHDNIVSFDHPSEGAMELTLVQKLPHSILNYC
jgi:hypothetical protein